MEHLNIDGKTVQIFAAAKPHAPLVILNTVHGEGEKVYRLVREETQIDFSMAVIGNIAWDDEMSPWAIPPISKNDTPCTGGADAYLEKLTTIILPEIMHRIPSEPNFAALAGYSLAGLFAVYAMYRTDVFSRIASASGSFWYPGILEYVREHEPRRKPERIYFSLGDKESKTKNKILQSVEENTRQLEKWYSASGVETVYEVNPGNHFRECDERMAKGICRILR